MVHRLEPRIRAHVLLCWLALLLIGVAERRTGLTWRRIAIDLGRVHAVTPAEAKRVSAGQPLDSGRWHATHCGTRFYSEDQPQDAILA